jgi:GNAT superfamily N-acetyltransferase
LSNKLPSAGKKVIFRKITCHPLTPDRWDDFEKLFGEKGACGGCWCMYWRLRRPDFMTGKGESNKNSMHDMVRKGHTTGFLMYADKQAVGWCAVAPRNEFPVLSNSRILKPVDEELVWSIVCFYIDRKFRRLGLTEIFLNYIILHCRKEGVKILEAYPVDAGSNADYPPVFAYTGFVSAYSKVGFKEVVRRSASRPIMRYFL